MTKVALSLSQEHFPRCRDAWLHFFYQIWWTFFTWLFLMLESIGTKLQCQQIACLFLTLPEEKDLTDIIGEQQEKTAFTFNEGKNRFLKSDSLHLG